MINIMLVDDEAFEREGLRKMLEKYRSNFTIVAEAKNGEEAAKYAIQLQPDVIFLDIKMPGMDGLEALRIISEHLPNTKFIMVSAFDTFEYAQESMKFGVKEYLLKPSKPSDIVQAYDRVIKEMESEEDHRMDQIRSQTLMEIEFLTSLMMDHIHEYDLDDWRNWFQLQDKVAYFTLFSFAAEKVYVSRQEKETWYQQLKNVLHQQETSCLVGPLTGFQVPVLVILNDDHHEQEEFVRTVIRETKPLLEACKLVVGVSELMQDLETFKMAYEQANQALERVYENKHASYLVYHEKLSDRKIASPLIELENAVIEKIQQGDTQAALRMFNQYFQQITNGGQQQMDGIRTSLEHFFIVLSRKVKELGIAEDYIYSFQNLESTTQIREEAKVRLIFITERIQEWQKSSADATIIRIKKYIDQHYKETLTLEGVAGQFNLSSYYVSKLFKAQFHISFIEYVTDVRMKKAKELIRDVSVPLKEIAITLGYRDPNYFSRVFKKTTGYSPSEYRKDYQQKISKH